MRTHVQDFGRFQVRTCALGGMGAVVFALAFALILVLAVPAAPSRADTEPTIVTPAAMLPVVYRVDTDEPVVFITVDDGIVRSREARDWVRRKKLPVTSFLTLNVTEGNLGYFGRISAYGSVQNHTVSHPFMDTYGGDLRAQICPVQDRFAERFGTRPWMLRPPYGAGARLARVHTAATSCGIRQIVMWDAVVDRGRLTTWNGQQLSRGSIILLHYGPNLKSELCLAVRSARAQGLRVAALEDYLRK